MKLNKIMEFEDWYYSGKGEYDGMIFIERLEELVRKKFDVEEFFAEPSTQLLRGSDCITITLKTGEAYQFVFDWEDEQWDIFNEGPKTAARSYFNRIAEGIKTGSALIE